MPESHTHRSARKKSSSHLPHPFHVCPAPIIIIIIINIMEPVSIEALLEVGYRVCQAIVVYIKRVRQTPDVVKSIEARVNAWKTQLEALKELQEEGDLTELTKTWLQQSGVLTQSYDCLTELASLVDKAPRPSREKSTSLEDYFKRLTWPLTAHNKAEELLTHLDHQRDEIAAALVRDTA